MPDQPSSRRQVLDHLGLVAGMFDALGIGDVIAQATHQNPALRDLTVGEAVKAMVLNGLGLINQALYLVPRCFHTKPTDRLVSPRMAPEPLNDDALGRALETLYAHGVTDLYSLIASTAAERLGLAPRFGHLDSPSFPVDGRYNSDEEPAAQVGHLTRGYSREHRPDLNQVMVELMVAHQAGIPILMKPLSGHSSDAHDVGDAVRAHLQPLPATDGLTSLVADSALYREANRQKLAQTHIKWITRVPAPVSAAQALLTQADPQRLAALTAGSRDHEVPPLYGGIEQRWVLIYSELRQAQTRRTVDKQWRQQRDKETKAFRTFCRTTFACETDARQALSTFAQDLQPIDLAASTVHAQPRDAQRGRPRPGVRPEQVVDQIDGALASALTARQALIAQHCGVLLATNALDPTPLPPHELLAGDKGQVHGERGFRFLKDPQFLASSLDLKKPARIMALLMVMTVCVLVYAALEYRLRQGLNAQAATFPAQRGKRIQHPTARWVFHYCVGIHVRCQAGQWPIVLNLTTEHQHWLRLLGQPYMALYDVQYS
jgi:transposase